MKKIAILLALATLLPLTTIAQNIKLSLECPPRVRANEAFQLVIRVNADATTPKMPEIPGIDILQNRGKSTSTSISYINGEWSTNSETTFSYILQANQEGTITIPPIPLFVDGKQHATKNFKLQVLPPDATAQASKPARQTTESQADNQPSAPSSSEVFAEILPTRTQLYQGESLTATLKIFSKLQVSSIDNISLPNFDGFYKQQVDLPPLHTLEQEEFRGQNYLTGALAQYVLFPQKSGKLTISPASLDVAVQKRVQSSGNSFFDSFFGTGYQTFNRTIKSPQLEINVLPLPEPKPATFSGGVGQFQLSLALDKKNTSANEPITLTLTIKGSGNPKFADPPKLDFPAEFDVYDPKITAKLNPSATAGTTTYEYLLIPRFGGSYEIPASSFIYFDPQTRTYQSIITEPLQIYVEGAAPPSNGSPAQSLPQQENLHRLAEDIHFIKTNLRVPQNSPEDGLPYLWHLILFAAALLLYLTIPRIIAKNPSKLRFKQANQHLRAAKRALYNEKLQPFYDNLSQALWLFLSCKLNLPIANLTQDSAKLSLDQRKVPEKISSAYLEVLSDCEEARYAPTASRLNPLNLYDRAADAINTLQNL